MNIRVLYATHSRLSVQSFKLLLDKIYTLKYLLKNIISELGKFYKRIKEKLVFINFILKCLMLSQTSSEKGFKKNQIIRCLNTWNNYEIRCL